MFDDLAAYFIENCLTGYREYARVAEVDGSGESEDMRLAMNAAVALYHLREHAPPAQQKTRAQIAAACPDYDLLGDIVNAGKHGVITRGKALQVKSAADIYEEGVVTHYQDAEGPYHDAVKVVTVQLVDGSTRDLHDILVNVINLWVDELTVIGAIANVARFTRPRTSGIPPRKVAGEAAQMTLKARQGVRFRQRFRLRRYNYTTGRVEPVDLTGASGTFRIYKPKLTLNLTITRTETGETIGRSIELTDDEVQAYKQLQDDEQRSAFGIALVNQRNLLADMLNLPEGTQPGAKVLPGTGRDGAKD